MNARATDEIIGKQPHEPMNHFCNQMRKGPILFIILMALQ
jgi:hypothetical protein